MRMSFLSIFRLFLIDLRKLLRFIETLNFVNNRKVVQGKKHLLYTNVARTFFHQKCYAILVITIRYLQNDTHCKFQIFIFPSNQQLFIENRQSWQH